MKQQNNKGMFKNHKYSNGFYMYLLDLEIIYYKRIILKALYNKMINKEISYEEYYESIENKYYWDLMKKYSSLIKLGLND